MAELVVAPEREPEVGAEVELAVVPQVGGQRHLRQQLREGLLQRGHRQVARPRPRVAPLQILAVAPERVPTDGVCLERVDNWMISIFFRTVCTVHHLAHSVVLLVGLAPHPHLVVAHPVHQAGDGPAAGGPVLRGVRDDDGPRPQEVLGVELRGRQGGGGHPRDLLGLAAGHRHARPLAPHGLRVGPSYVRCLKWVKVSLTSYDI